MNSLYRTSGDPAVIVGHGSLDELLRDAANNAGLYVAGTPTGSVLTQVSGPPWARTGTSDGRLLGAVWVGNVRGGEPIEFRITEPSGVSKYGKFDIVMRQAVNMVYPEAFSDFSSNEKLAMGIAGVSAVALAAWAWWPDSKRENPRRRR